MARRLGARGILAKRIAAGQGFRVKTAGDAKVCDACRAKAGQYKNGNGDAPPYHPNCRCGK